MIFLHLNKQDLQTNIEKTIKQNELHIEAVELAIKGLETVKHHKQISKRGLNAIKELGQSAYFELEFTPRLKLWLTNRTYEANSDYFADYEPTIWFKSGDGYTEIIQNCHDYIEGRHEALAQLKADLENIDQILKESEELEQAYKKLTESIHYTTRKQLNFN